MDAVGAAGDTTTPASPYPAHWEADVVLRDGRTAHLRPIRPDDADRLVAFYDLVSDESKYFRFFAPHPTLSPREVAHFTSVDYADRVAVIALLGDEILGVVRYERLPSAGEREPVTAEVAFLIQDAHQGRGLGSVLLEHLAAAARERGIERFVAQVLPANRKMITVFRDAGYLVASEFGDGVVEMSFDVAETDTALAVRLAREHRAEARSIAALLRPRSVAVVGASRRPGSVGHTVLTHLVAAGYTGTLVAVNPKTDEVAGVPSYPGVADVPGSVDLAVVAVPAEEVERAVEECAVKRVRGLVVMSGGFAETGAEGRERQTRLVRIARSHGMRVVGPLSFGMMNTAADLRLNASLAPDLAPPGRIGFFSQSGALGVAALDTAAQRGLGVSTFLSAGNRADVSGNDLLQYWEDDPDTDIVLLYLQSIGNPRKFSRLARRVGRAKPVVAVKSGRASQGAPLGHTVRASRVPVAAVDAMFDQSGVLRVEGIDQLIDVAQLLATQPLPAGPRLAILGNSDALELVAADAATANGLTVVGQPVALPTEAGAAAFQRALDEVLRDSGVDSVLAVFVAPFRVLDEGVARVLAAAAARSTKTVVGAFLGVRGVDLPAAADEPGPLPDAPDPDAARRGLPAYPTPEEAVRALATVSRYAEWRRLPAGTHPELPEVRAAQARALVDAELAAHPAGVALAPHRLAELLDCYGIALEPAVRVATPDDAVAAAGRLGYPVVLKSIAPHLQHRPELGEVRTDLDSAARLRAAYAGMIDALGPAAIGSLVVQRMVAPGVAVVLESMEDELFGPVVSFGIGGLATELLGDRAYGIPPLTDADAARLVRAVKAAPVLFGHRGAAPVHVAALEQLLLRVARLADDLPEVVALELNPVLVAPTALNVLGGHATLVRPLVRTDRGARALLG